MADARIDVTEAQGTTNANVVSIRTHTISERRGIIEKMAPAHVMVDDV